MSNFHQLPELWVLRPTDLGFGWLDEEEKHAILLQLGVDDTLNAGSMKEVVEAFQLREEEYLGDSLALLVENGEKEYSFEIAGIQGNQVEVLWRYTIGGSDRVQNYFEPEPYAVAACEEQYKKYLRIQKGCGT